MMGPAKLVACVVLAAALAGCTRTATGPTQAAGLDTAEAALQGGSPAIAAQLAAGVLQTDPANVAALDVQGDALTALGRTDEAEASYAAALKGDRSDTRANLGLGRLRLGSDPASAAVLFQDVLKRDPRNETALVELGIARDLQGRHADAQQAYQQALKVNPALAAARVNLALSLAMSGEADDAVRLIRPMATAPEASRKLRHDYAAVLALAGERAEAERVLAPDLSPAEISQFLEAVGTAGPRAAVDVGPGAGPPSQAGEEPQAGAEVAPAPVALSAEGSVLVQLAAASSEAAAQAEWQHLQEQSPTLLAGHRPDIARSRRDGQVLWHLRTGGFADVAAASAFCEQLRTAAGTCEVVSQ